MDDHLLYDNLLVELECPICTNYMSPPIRQCATGHSICDSCIKRLPRCALCQGSFTNSRNLSLEGLAVKMHYPCINRPAGCLARLSYREREIHELRCDKKGFKCPMDKCTWMGKLEDILDHWASKKTSSRPYRESNVCHAKLKTDSFYVNIMNAHNNIFWFKCKLTKTKIFWSVQYVGNAAEAQQYYYEIEIFKQGRPKRKHLISDYCQSHEMPDYQLFRHDGSASLWMSTEILSDFVNDDQLLIYYLRVNATDEVQKGSGDLAAGTTGYVKKDNARNHRARSKGPVGQHFVKGQKGGQTNNPTPNKGKEGFIFI